MLAVSVPLPVLFVLGATLGLATEKRSVPSLPLASMPSLFCAFTSAETAVARRPRLFCAGMSVLLRKSIRPPSAPPPSWLSSMLTVPPGLL